MSDGNQKQDRRRGAPSEHGQGGRGEPDRGALAGLPVHPGLCATCAHLRLLASRRSVFVRCGLAAEDLSFRRYPALPVLSCSGYEAPPTR